MKQQSPFESYQVSRRDLMIGSALGSILSVPMTVYAADDDDDANDSVQVSPQGDARQVRVKLCLPHLSYYRQVSVRERV
jgi:hypothetical protein